MFMFVLCGFWFLTVLVVKGHKPRQAQSSPSRRQFVPEQMSRLTARVYYRSSGTDIYLQLNMICFSHLWRCRDLFYICLSTTIH